MTKQELLNKVKVLLLNGTLIPLMEWQKTYGLPTGSLRVGKYFGVDTDHRLKRDILSYGELVVCAPLIQLLDDYREATGRTTINSFNRNTAKQRYLRQMGYRAALMSTHEKKIAADIDTVSEAETKANVKILQTLADKRGLKIRVGWKKYLKQGQTFIHLDVAPMYYAQGMVWHEEAHPEQWEKALSW